MKELSSKQSFGIQELSSVQFSRSVVDPRDCSIPGFPVHHQHPFPSSRGLPDPAIETRSPALQADLLPSEPPGKPKSFLSWLLSCAIIKSIGKKSHILCPENNALQYSHLSLFCLSRYPATISWTFPGMALVSTVSRVPDQGLSYSHKSGHEEKIPQYFSTNNLFQK